MVRRATRDSGIIKLKIKAGKVGLTMEYELPLLSDLLRRANDLRPALDAAIADGFGASADQYVRQDRWHGGIGAPDRDGRRRNWGTGYKAKLASRTTTKRTAKILFRRPFAPVLKVDVAITPVTDRVLYYLVSGDVQ